MVDHILEIPRLEVFGDTFFSCNTSELRNNLARNKDDIEVVIS